MKIFVKINDFGLKWQSEKPKSLEQALKYRILHAVSYKLIHGSDRCLPKTTLPWECTMLNLELKNENRT